VLCGLAPALETSRARLTYLLKEDARSGGGRRRLFRGLVVTEVALAVLLLAAAGLLLESFAGIQRLRHGFDSSNVVTFWVRPPASRYPLPRVPPPSSACSPRRAGTRRRVGGRQPVHAVHRLFPHRPLFQRSAKRSVTAPVVGRHYVSRTTSRPWGFRSRRPSCADRERLVPAVLPSP
jgi:hypothetical protein